MFLLTTLYWEQILKTSIDLDIEKGGRSEQLKDY